MSGSSILDIPTRNKVNALYAGTATLPAVTLTNQLILGVGTKIVQGSGNPEGAVTAPVGSLYLRNDGSTGTTLYTKETGTGNTGWVVVAGTGSGGMSGDVDGGRPDTVYGGEILIDGGTP